VLHWAIHYADIPGILAGWDTPRTARLVKSAGASAKMAFRILRVADSRKRIRDLRG
jgi:hypothetical protein